MLRRSRIFFLSIATLVCTLTLPATTIDFEAFNEGDNLGPVVVGGNTVTFGVGAGAAPTGDAFVVEVGGPLTGFEPLDSPNSGAPGAKFLTDELVASPGLPTQGLNYFMTFAVPIINLSLDLYDFRDGGAGPGDTATLTLFSDAFTTAVTSVSFMIPAILPLDGNVVNLAAASGAFNILSASLVFSDADIGTGIDNVNFTSAPEPWSVFLLGSGMLGMGRALRRRRKLTANQSSS